ncbi:Reticulon-like protein B13 [Linum perenne]
MSGTTSSDSTAHYSSAGQGSTSTVGDVILWRNPKLSSLLFSTATLTWLLFNIYKFSFVTLASFVGMLVVSSFFLYANFVRFFRKEEPDLSGVRSLLEKKVVEAEKSIREWSVVLMQCGLSASTNEDWKVFSMLLLGLALLAYAGTLFDFLTLFYLGVVMILTVPVMYEKNEERMLEAGAKVQLMAIKVAYKVDEKVIRRLKGKVVAVAAVDGGDANKEHKDELKDDDLKTD